MYARYQQYNQYQNQNQNNNQYQHQAAAAAAVQAQTQQQQQQQHHQQQPSPQTQIVPPNPVQTYTQYYHVWTKRAEELTSYLKTLQQNNHNHNQNQNHYGNNNNNNNNERQTAESNLQWAKYYAEESSRAAHHFNQQPQATSAPFALPPAPPTTTVATTTTTIQPAFTTGINSNNNMKSNNSNSNHNSKSSSSSSNPTGSITRWVRRNMERPQVQNDPQLKAHVQAKIETEIATAIQKGALQSKNWDDVALVALPLEASAYPTTKQVPPPPPPPPPPPQPQYQQQQQQSCNGRHYYEHNSSVVVPTNNNYYGNSTNKNTNNNYYGSSASPVALTTSAVETDGSYYGPDSSSHNNPVHNVQRKNINKNININNNYNSFSSSPFTGQHKNKNNKRPHHYQQQQQHQEEDFIAFGSYGPCPSPIPSNSNINSSKKKTKKNHRKSSNITMPTTMHDAGLDYSQQAMTKRANRFSGRGGIHEANNANDRSSNINSEHDKYMGKRTIGGTNVTLDETDFEQMTVKGTSTTVEKAYLRLTAPPRAELVRPLGILQQHLRNLQCEYYYFNGIKVLRDKDNDGGYKNKNNNSTILQERMRTPQEKWKITDDDDDDGNEEKVLQSKDCRRRRRRRHDYLWFCSQLKAIRQDCTVQRIQSDLAVDVYETHARIALQEGDLNEYNQCQTQLKELYKTQPFTDNNKSVHDDGNCNGGDALDNGKDGSPFVWKDQEEFIAYRLLYYVFLSTNEQYSGGSSDMFHIMLSLTLKERNHPAISHALQVREAVAFSDYFWFFRLHKKSPNLGIFLTEILVPIMRMRGLRRIAKAYRPSVELSVCLHHLGFCDAAADDGDDGNNITDGRNEDGGKINEEGKSWLISCGAVIDGSKFVTKDSEIHTPDTKDKKNSLI